MDKPFFVTPKAAAAYLDTADADDRVTVTYPSPSVDRRCVRMAERHTPTPLARWNASEPSPERHVCGYGANVETPWDTEELYDDELYREPLRGARGVTWSLVASVLAWLVVAYCLFILVPAFVGPKVLHLPMRAAQGVK